MAVSAAQTPSPRALVLHPSDDVAVALADLEVGERLDIADPPIELIQPIPRGHKLALADIADGQPLHKFGYPIGHAQGAIRRGEWVHSHNLATNLSGTLDYRYQPGHDAVPAAAHAQDRSFLGYRRADGRVGTRNEIWVICTVGCVANTARRIAARAHTQFAGRIDGVHAITHPFGCSQLGDDLEHTARVLAGLVRHPNAGAVLIVGLGCESLQMRKLLAEVGDVDASRLRWFEAQRSSDELSDGLAAVQALVEHIEGDQREPCPLSDLALGLKCGGSDAFSGITANPLVGRMADRLAAAGGTPILTEIPEIFGAEHLLMERAVDQSVFDDVVSVVNGFKQYFLKHDQPVSENPSPGNLAGGITTLEEKSLGAVQKGGHSPLTQVLRYGDRTRRTGLALLEAPGNDAVSSTALVAAGATIVLFTTGRGTPLGFPAPTLKIASNSALAQAKPGWIDFDAGVLVGGADPEQTTERLLDLIIATASGQPARNELNEEREIAIWKTGVTL